MTGVLSVAFWADDVNDQDGVVVRGAKLGAR